MGIVRTTRRYRIRRRRRRKGAKTTAVARRGFPGRQPRFILGGFPRSKTVKLRYVSDPFILDPGIGSVATHRFRANSIFDPDYELGGHQPYGHDQWQNIYNHYQVVWSSIKCVFRSSGTSTSLGSALCTIQLRDDSTVTTTPTLAPETGRGRYCFLSVDDGNANQRHLKAVFKSSRFFGRRDTNDLKANFGADPADAAVFHVTAEPSAAADTSGVYCQAVMDFIVRFTEPKDFGQS